MPESDPLPHWPRKNFQPGGGNADLFYKVHGTFPAGPEVSRTRHRCDGVPDECSLELYTRSTEHSVVDFGLGEEWLGRMLRTEAPALAEAIRRTDQCVVLRGEVPDPPDLDYFRDAVGLVTALLDSGGIAVFDPHIFKWWSAEEWRRSAFEPAGSVPRTHVTILVSDDAQPGTRWYHTRGMRKFGRPDLSVRGVTPKLKAGVDDLLNRFIELLAFGWSSPTASRSGWCPSLPTGAASTAEPGRIPSSTTSIWRLDATSGRELASSAPPMKVKWAVCPGLLVRERGWLCRTRSCRPLLRTAFPPPELCRGMLAVQPRFARLAPRTRG